MENGGNQQRETSFDIDYNNRETSLINDRATFLEQESATSIMNDSSTKLDSENEKNLDSEKLIGTTLQGENGQYVIEKLLTKAGESKIFLCKKDQKEYVAKIYIGTILLNKEKRKAFLDLLYQQSYPYILSLEDYGIYEDMPFDIYPYMKNGDISKANLDLNFIHTVLVPNLNEVLHYIHGKGVIHRDIKPQNILFSDDKQSIKITDFGILSIADGTSSITSTHRTNGYAAPEIYTGVADYESDYYAMGITLLSVLIHGDVFEGYPEEQIMRNTIYGTIPHLNRKKVSVSEMTLKDRIEGLICGLTMIDIKKRWGYEQVKQWCEGKLHFPDDLKQEEQREFEKPFIWEGNYCYTASAMALALSKTWEKSKRESGRGLFADWLKFYRPDIATDLYYLIENSRWKTDAEKDIGLFKVIYTIDPSIKGFRWKGNVFSNFSELAEALQKEKEEAFEQLLLTEGISWYLEKIESEYPVTEELKKTVHEIEQFTKRNRIEGYQRFIFQFLPKNTPRIFSFLGKEFKNIEELASNLEQLEPLEENAKHILLDTHFSVWMWYFGYDDLLTKAKNNLKNAFQEDIVERFLILLNQCLPKNSPRIFRIFGKNFKSIKELAFRLDELEPLKENAKKILLSPHFSTWITSFGYEDFLINAKKNLKTALPENAVEPFLILLEDCLPENFSRPFYIFGKSFKNVEELASKLSFLEPLEENAVTILLSPYFSAWMYHFGYDDLLWEAKKDLNFFQPKEIVERFFILLEKCLPESFLRTLHVFELSFTSISELVDELSKLDSLDYFAKEILSSPYFAVWILHLGYRDLWKKATKDFITAENAAEKFLILLEQILLEQCSNDKVSAIRKIAVKQVKKKGEVVFWLKEHLEQYIYLTEEAKNLKFVLENTAIEESMSVEKIYDALSEFFKAYIRFTENAYKDPFYFYYGLIPKNESAGIIPIYIDAYFIKQGDVFLPIAFAKEKNLAIRLNEKIEVCRNNAKNLLQHIEINLKNDFKELEKNLKTTEEEKLETQLKKLSMSSIDKNEKFEQWAERENIKNFLEEEKDKVKQKKKMSRSRKYYWIENIVYCIASAFFFGLGILYLSDYEIASILFFICAACFVGILFYRFICIFIRKSFLEKEKNLTAQINCLKTKILAYFYHAKKVDMYLNNDCSSFETEIKDTIKTRIHSNDLVEAIESIYTDKTNFYKKNKLYHIFMINMSTLLIVVWAVMFIIYSLNDKGIDLNMLLHFIITAVIWFFYFRISYDSEKYILRNMKENLQGAIEEGIEHKQIDKKNFWIKKK